MLINEHKNTNKPGNSTHKVKDGAIAAQDNEWRTSPHVHINPPINRTIIMSPAMLSNAKKVACRLGTTQLACCYQQIANWLERFFLTVIVASIVIIVNEPLSLFDIISNLKSRFSSRWSNLTLHIYLIHFVMHSWIYGHFDCFHFCCSCYRASHCLSLCLRRFAIMRPKRKSTNANNNEISCIFHAVYRTRRRSIVASLSFRYQWQNETSIKQIKIWIQKRA